METINGVSMELNELLKTVRHSKRIEKGTFLFQEGVVAKELFIINSGKVQVSKIVPDGRELTLRMCSDGDIIGELSLFSEDTKYMMNARVLEDGLVSVISKEELEEQFKSNNALSLEFMKWMSLQYRKTQTKFRDLILHGKKGALYSTLIRLSNSYGVYSENGITLDVTLTNQELANFCGTSREVVNRLLSELRKQHILSIDKGTITIHDIQYLKDEIDCENCSIEICNIE